MNAESIVAVSAAVLTMTQLGKWAGLPDKFGPLAVMVFAAFGVALWGWSADGVTRVTAFSYFVGWLAVTLAASGTYGFSRASGTALTRLTAPSSTGAGSEPTVKD
jgi:hypothetical protein